MLSEIEASNVTLRCVSFSVLRHMWCCPPAKSEGTTESLECACASSLAARRPVHVLQAQHKWATELARTDGKALSNAPLFPASTGSTVRQAPASSACRWTRQRDRFATVGTPSGSSHVVPCVLWNRRGEYSCMAVGVPVLSQSTCDFLRWRSLYRWKPRWAEIIRQCRSKYRYDQKYCRNNSARADFCSSLRQIIRALQNFQTT